MDERIEDTFSGLSEGLGCRFVVTARDERTALQAAQDAIARSLIIFGELEGGIEGLTKDTPDSRVGAIVNLWAAASNPKKSPAEVLRKFESDVSRRIRQAITVKLPPPRVFDDPVEGAEGMLNMRSAVGAQCGGGYEWIEKLYDRTVTIVPTMVPDFVIEDLHYARGFIGANFRIMCDSEESVIEASNKALEAVRQIPYVVAPFGACGAGSMIGATTDYLYCSSLKKKLGNESKVPEGIYGISEIVIDGFFLDNVKRALKVGIDAALNVKGVVKITASQYGDFKINLTELYK